MKQSKITKGRNLLWESSRMMLPEHREELIKYRQTLTERSRPIVDEQRLEQFNTVICDSISNEQEITIHIFGVFEDIMVKGIVQNVDGVTKRIRVITEQETKWIKLAEIVDVHG